MQNKAAHPKIQPTVTDRANQTGNSCLYSRCSSAASSSVSSTFLTSVCGAVSRSKSSAPLLPPVSRGAATFFESFFVKRFCSLFMLETNSSNNLNIDLPKSFNVYFSDQKYDEYQQSHQRLKPLCTHFQLTDRRINRAREIH
uniref:Uncharacterized protein n=1 Tax=Romanomermis culicivorax TaxID=13658 RepID=A0A915JF69_ROMCU